MSAVQDFFNSDNFMPHGHCFLWQPDILWLHILSDGCIALAYYAIPLALLYFSQLGRSNLAIQKADPNAMIDEIRLMLEPVLKEKNAIIEVPVPLPQVVCDRVRITEVFRNLITNAIKYNDKAEKKVEVGFLAAVDTPQGREKNVFYVKDNGIGIAPEHFVSIFRIFKKLNESHDEKDGTGVGLTFVKKIVERAGGRIWLESKPKEGTVFYFTLGAG